MECIQHLRTLAVDYTMGSIQISSDLEVEIDMEPLIRLGVQVTEYNMAFII